MEIMIQMHTDSKPLGLMLRNLPDRSDVTADTGALRLISLFRHVRRTKMTKNTSLMKCEAVHRWFETGLNLCGIHFSH